MGKLISGAEAPTFLLATVGTSELVPSRFAESKTVRRSDSCKLYRFSLTQGCGFLSDGGGLPDLAEQVASPHRPVSRCPPSLRPDGKPRASGRGEASVGWGLWKLLLLALDDASGRRHTRCRRRNRHKPHHSPQRARRLLRCPWRRST